MDTRSRASRQCCIEEYQTKTAAVNAAKTRARADEPSQVKVHTRDGIMEYESTYGDDPRRSLS